MGVEGSAHAGAAAWGFLKQEGDGEGGIYGVKDKEVGRGEAVCVVGDFFEGDWVDEVGGGKFDVIYDNTVSSSISSPRLRGFEMDR